MYNEYIEKDMTSTHTLTVVFREDGTLDYNISNIPDNRDGQLILSRILITLATDLLAKVQSYN